LFRIAGASQRASTAQNTELRHHLRTIILHTNRLERAFANTFIAILTFVLSSLDEAILFHAHSEIFCQAAAGVRAFLPL
jgi:hypothetical protein